jgi:hypothetical protein
MGWGRFLPEKVGFYPTHPTHPTLYALIYTYNKILKEK